MINTATLTTAILLTGTVASADTVEIYLLDLLDNKQNGYCLDISGGQGAQADPANGLQGHTCYSPSGEIFVDQGFDNERFGSGTLYIPEFNVCAEVTSFEVGAAVELASCDESDTQSFVFSENGAIVPASAPDLCLTLAESTRSGRSDTNQIKELALADCTDDASAFQTWGSRVAPK